MHRDQRHLVDPRLAPLGIGGELGVCLEKRGEQGGEDVRDEVLPILGPGARGAPCARVGPFAEIDAEDDVGFVVRDGLVDVRNGAEGAGAVLLDQTTKVGLWLVRRDERGRLLEGRGSAL